MLLALRGALVWAAILWTATLTAASSAYGTDFRILSRVFIDGGHEPVGEYVTVFRAGRVYDWRRGSDENVVYDPPQRRFVLIDARRKIRTEIGLDHVEHMAEQMRDQLLIKARKDESSVGELSAFLARPDYHTAIDGNEATFRGRWMTYEISTQRAPNTDIAGQYGQFLLWYTRLNAIRDPSRLAREPINAWLGREQRLPLEIRLETYRQGALGRMRKQGEFRSEHQIMWTLSGRDRERIEQVGRWLSEFRQVGFTTWWKNDDNRPE